MWPAPIRNLCAIRYAAATIRNSVWGNLLNRAGYAGAHWWAPCCSYRHAATGPPLPSLRAPDRSRCTPAPGKTRDSTGPRAADSLRSISFLPRVSAAQHRAGRCLVRLHSSRLAFVTAKRLPGLDSPFRHFRSRLGSDISSRLRRRVASHPSRRLLGHHESLAAAACGGNRSDVKTRALGGCTSLRGGSCARFSQYCS